MPSSTRLFLVVGVLALAACAASTHPHSPAAAGQNRSVQERAREALAAITIPDMDDVRGNVTLPAILAAEPGATLRWTSSNPNVVSDRAHGAIAAGVVRRPPVGAAPAKVTLSACLTVGAGEACRDFVLTVRPAVSLAPFTRYGIANFARSNNQAGQQIYMAASVGNDPTRWVAVNGGRMVLESTRGMHAVRDPSIVRSPEGDRFYLVATDLNVDGRAFGWQGWDWAQSGASRSIEVWESDDLRHWSEQRHVLSPYWSADLASGRWTPIDWGQKPDYDLARGVLRHGHVFALTQAEHAALRGAALSSLSVRTPPTKATYTLGQPLDLRGLVVTAAYTDGTTDEVLVPGYGGYLVSGYDATLPGAQTVTVSYTVVGRTKTASFQVVVGR